MTGMATAGTQRFTVRSPDGVELAVWVDGDGPPLVLVHGSLQDHSISAPLIAELRADFTTMAMDRRGFGASGDAPAYSLRREFADVAAVVDAGVARTELQVVVWGHSFGASCAMGGAAVSAGVSHLILYEPSLGLAYPEGWVEGAEAALAARGEEDVVVSVLRDLLGLTDAEIAARRTQPEWPGRVATAPTVVREARAEQEWVYRPGDFDAISASTLLLAGAESPPALKDATDAALAAIPGARLRVLEGHAHLAHRTDPAMVAAVIREFAST